MDRKTTPRGSNFWRSRSRAGSEHLTGSEFPEIQADDPAPQFSDRSFLAVGPAADDPVGSEFANLQGLRPCRTGDRGRRPFGCRAELDSDRFGLAVHHIGSGDVEIAEGEVDPDGAPSQVGDREQAIRPGAVRIGRPRPRFRSVRSTPPRPVGPPGRPPFRSRKDRGSGESGPRPGSRRGPAGTRRRPCRRPRNRPCTPRPRACQDRPHETASGSSGGRSGPGRRTGLCVHPAPRSAPPDEPGSRS